MKYIFYIVFICLLTSCATQSTISTTGYTNFDTWIKNGIVLLPNGETSDADIFIKNGEIINVTERGKLDINELQKYILNKEIKIIDANGNFVMPGLIDAHAHFISLGKNKSNLDFLGTNSWNQIIEMVKEEVKKTPKGGWITGRGWHQEKWSQLPDNLVEGFPVHDLLSQIAPNHPVYLTHASGHGLIANKKAMELAGVTLQTFNPEGGIILKDTNGQPTGIFQENAMNLIYDAYQSSRNLMTMAEKDEEWMEYLHLAEEECLSQGITTVHDAGIGWDEAQKFKQLADDKKLNVRLYTMLSDYTIQNTPLPKLKAYIETTRNDRFFTNIAVKAYVDGALGSRGAWLLEEYTDLPGYKGENVTPIDNLTKTAKLSKELDLQLCIHAIGDRGNREVIDVFEKVMGKSLEARRWRIEHAQHLNPADINRIAKLNIIASMQTVHCTSDAPYVEKRLGQQRAEEGAYVWQKLLNKNVAIANGTDAPIERINPFENLYAAVTRKRLDNGLTFYPEQRMSRKKALEIYTQGNAYAAFQEDWKGKIQVGYVADIIILDTNLLACEELEIPRTKVLYTLVNGDIKYQQN